MAIANLRGYKAFMQGIGILDLRPRAVRGAAVLLIPLLALGACSDEDSAGPPAAGAGGENSAGASSESGAGGAHAGEGNIGPAGAAGDSGGGDAGSPGGTPQGDPCERDADCDDRLYCNGTEKCIPRVRDGEVKICWSPPLGPCADRECDEQARACDCSNPDGDGDGAPIEGCAATGVAADCDDADGLRAPTKPEVCEGDDSAKDRDEDCNDQTYVKRDVDKDGFYDAACGNTSLYYGDVVGGSDCRDDLGGDRFNPLAREECDLEDNDCDGEIDNVNGFSPGEVTKYYPDRDGDLYGDAGAEPQPSRCAQRPGYSTNFADCDDSTAEINPAREEICNGKDDDCDQKVDLPRAEGTLMLDQPLSDQATFECMGDDGWAVAECAAGRLNCGDESYLDGCETIGTTLCNCHACGNTCNFSCGESACEEIVSVSAGAYHTCAVRAAVDSQGESLGGGKLVCWGLNAAGQLGNGSTKSALVPTPTQELVEVTAVASGAQHTCAIVGTNGALFCWGDNASGQVGTSQIASALWHPVRVENTSGGMTTVSNVAAGFLHTCAVYEGGKLACWGQGQLGRLGDGVVDVDEYVVPIPTQVRRERDGVPSYVEDAKQVVTGRQHTCVLTTQGSVECWGDNSVGQLGGGLVVAASGTAQAINGVAGVEQIAAGAYHTCARVQGRVYCWGDNSNGQLAREGESSGLPVLIPLMGSATSIQSGSYFACARIGDGSLHCWGNGEGGQRGCSQNGAQPNVVLASNVRAAFGGYGGHLCALSNAGSVTCWGNNTQGALGAGFASDEPQCRPLSLLPLHGATACVSPQTSEVQTTPRR